MLTKLNGKKLLILGGIRPMLEVVNRAKEFGILVYVTDYNEDSPCKAVADKSFMVNATDVDAVVALCKEEGIDGVLTGYVDMLLPYYAQICEKSGLPCYATQEQFNLFTDKKAIKKACDAYEVPCPKEYSADDIDNILIDYPVIVKPADSSGSRGVTICNNKEALDAAIDEALSYSKKKTYVVEDYLTDGVVLMHYYLQDCNINFVGMGDCYRQEVGDGKIPMTTIVRFPSKYTESFLACTNAKIVKMFQGLGLKNGQLEIEAFVKNSEIYVGDIGYRLCGSRLQYLFRSILDVYSPDLLIHFALTGKMADYDLSRKMEPYMYGKCAYRLNILSMPGRIDRIIGRNEIENHPSVVGAAWIAQEGDTIMPSDIGKIKQIICRIYGVSKSSDALSDTLKDVYNTVDYLSEGGASLKQSMLDFDKLNHNNNC